MCNRRYSLSKNIFYEELVNELHAWIENHPNVIHSTNVKDPLFVKINGTLFFFFLNLFQISRRELHNDMILTSSEGGFSSAITVHENKFNRRYVT